MKRSSLRFALLALIVLFTISACEPVYAQESNITGFASFQRAPGLGFKDGARIGGDLDVRVKPFVFSVAASTDLNDKLFSDATTVRGVVAARLYVNKYLFAQGEAGASKLFTPEFDKSATILGFGGGVNFNDRVILSYVHRVSDNTSADATSESVRADIFYHFSKHFGVKIKGSYDFVNFQDVTERKFAGNPAVGAGLTFFF